MLSQPHRTVIVVHGEIYECCSPEFDLRNEVGIMLLTHKIVRTGFTPNNDCKYVHFAIVKF